MIIEAMKQALEVLDAGPNAYFFMNTGGIANKLRQAIQEAEKQESQPEPPSDENIFDAWVSASDSDGIVYDGLSFERGYRIGRGEYDEYTGALVADAVKQAIADLEKQEPVAWQWRRKDKAWSLDNTFNSEVYATTSDSEVRPLYTHPQPKRTWVGLTDEERNRARQTITYSQLAMMTAEEWDEAVQIETERRLKEKNT